VQRDQTLPKLTDKPTFNRENTMSKKPTKDSVTTASIEEQTAAFLKAGGAVQYVVKGKSGQIAPVGPKPVTPKPATPKPVTPKDD
jgi:hypothetical protein